MVQPESELLAESDPHNPSHFLDMRRKRFAVRTAGNAASNIGNIKSSGQHGARNESVNSAIRLSELCDLKLFIVLVRIQITDLLEIISGLCKLSAQFSPMS